MNQSELDSILKKSRTPEPPKEFWEKFPARISRKLNRERTENFRPERNWFPRLAWGLATAICILAAFAVGHWRGQTETRASTGVLANAKVIREMLAMFPNRVRAITQDERGLNLVLSDRDDVPVSTPIYISICDGEQCSSFVTFSGQELQIAGQKVTVLSDARGGIILTGNNFVWSNTEQSYADNRLKIEAKNLNSIPL